MAISESERIRNREAQRKFRLTHPRYSAKYPDRQRRYWARLTAKKQGKEITSDIAIKPRIGQTKTRLGDTKQREKTQQKNRILNLKITVLTRYGGGKLACVICGESRHECLSIDHINGNGNEHRRRIFGTRYCKNMYSWLKKNNYPEGFQTLCMNCQFVKRVTNNELGKRDIKLEDLNNITAGQQTSFLYGID